MSKLKPEDFNAPAILLGRPVDYDMYKDFRTKLDQVPKRRPDRHRIVDARRRSGSGPHVGEDIRTIATIRRTAVLSSSERLRSIPPARPS